MTTSLPCPEQDVKLLVAETGAERLLSVWVDLHTLMRQVIGTYEYGHWYIRVWPLVYMSMAIGKGMHVVC